MLYYSKQACSEQLKWHKQALFYQGEICGEKKYLSADIG
jgi:hypothetical protein